MLLKFMDYIILYLLKIAKNVLACTLIHKHSLNKIMALLMITLFSSVIVCQQKPTSIRHDEHPFE